MLNMVLMINYICIFFTAFFALLCVAAIFAFSLTLTLDRCLNLVHSRSVFLCFISLLSFSLFLSLYFPCFFLHHPFNQITTFSCFFSLYFSLSFFLSQFFIAFLANFVSPVHFSSATPHLY